MSNFKTFLLMIWFGYLYFTKI